MTPSSANDKLRLKKRCVYRLSAVFIILLILSAKCYSQKQIPENLCIDGIVSGYYQNTETTATKKEKQIKLEGVIADVTIRVMQNDKTVLSTKTDKKGLFQLTLKTGNVFLLEYSKLGYTTCNLIIDLSKVPEDIASEGLLFENFELLLNSYGYNNNLNKTLPFGRLYYDAAVKSFAFEEKNITTKKSVFTKQKIENPSVSLIIKAIENNKNKNAPKQSVTEKGYVSEMQSNIINNKNTITRKSSDRKLTSIVFFNHVETEKITINDIIKRESELAVLRKQIEKDKLNAKTSQDSIIIEQKEAMLMAAENELEMAKKYIKIQDKVISDQYLLLILLIGFVALLFVFLFIIFKNYKQRKATNILLEKKNKQITDSINYASRIQKSILLKDEEIKRIVPRSFVFYQPREIVSGDYYWFSQIDEKIIVAAVDCTGHGVPGAFMSFIGYSLMNEIINEKKTAQPSVILSKLHDGVVKILRQNEGDINSQDGMELSLCIYDKVSGIMEFAGAMNSVYVVKNNEIIILESDERPIGGMSMLGMSLEKIPFTDKIIQISENDIVYLFSDGFADQFGGDDNAKFNNSRFKKLLLDINQKPLDEQKLLLENSINTWKGDHKQIDDMLIIGVKF